MEFWGVEVKAGQKLKVDPGSCKVLHLSQASLGESKKDKGNESVPLFLKVDDQELVIGILSTHKCTHITYDLVFEKEFELSHNWANGSVYFCGYKSLLSEEGDEDDSSEDESSDEEELAPLVFEENGIPEQKDDVLAKPSTDNAKSIVKVVEPIKEDTDSDSDESGESSESGESDDEEDDPIKEEKVKEEEDTDSDDEEDGSEDGSDEEMAGSSDDEDDDSSDDEDNDESSDEEDEVTPKKAEQNKKRSAPPAESDPKTPTGKKAKLVTPQKIVGEGKKTGGHISTPYPSKQAGKTSANKDKSKQHSPASDGQAICGSCSKSLKSDKARDSHSKVKKHGASK